MNKNRNKSSKAKLAALVTAAVLAVSVLTSCGGNDRNDMTDGTNKMSENVSQIASGAVSGLTDMVK